MSDIRPSSCAPPSHWLASACCAAAAPIPMPALSELAEALGADLDVVVGVPEHVEIDGIHVSELPDPTPYLGGGELLLTVGLGFGSTDVTAYVARLAQRGVRALGVGLGPVLAEIPAELVQVCVAAQLPLCVVPPEAAFLSVTRTFWQTVAHQEQAGLRHSLGALTDLVRAAGGRDPGAAVVQVLADALGGWAAWVSPDGALTHVAPAAARPDLAGLSHRIREVLGGEPRVPATLPWNDGQQVSVQPLVSAGRLRALLVTGSPDAERAPDHRLVVAAQALLAPGLHAPRESALRALAQREAVAHLVLAGEATAAGALADSLGHEQPARHATLAAISGLPDHARGDLIGDDERGCTAPGAGPRAWWGERAEIVWAVVPLEAGARVEAAVRRAVAAHPRAAAVLAVPLAADSVAAQVSAVGAAVTHLDAGRVVVAAHADTLGPDAADAAADRALDALMACPGELLVTLGALLRRQGRIDPCARDLGVHRNTVRSRLAAIRRVTDADPFDPDTSARWWLALRRRGLA